MSASIKVGSRIYLRHCIAGEPGIVVSIDAKGRARIHWPDLYAEMGRDTFHAVDSLVVDESFRVSQLGFDFGEIAA